MEFSVIVTNYNQTLDRILGTLASIVAQRFDDFELIYADDCSREAYFEEVESFLRERGFDRYKLLHREKNLGTVRNNLDAVLACSGRYVKSIGTGDLLFDEDTLAAIYEYAEQHEERMLFGRIRTFSQTDEGILVGDFAAPSCPERYNVDDIRSLAGSQILRGDWVPGGSLIFTREAALEYLRILADEYKVVYVEDFVSVLALCEERVGFFDRDIFWYEWGVGISNSGSRASRVRMYADHTKLYEGLVRRYPDDAMMEKSMNRFRLKRFIALHTHIYGVLARHLASRYTGTPHAAGDSSGERFLVDSLAEATSYRDGLADVQVREGDDVHHR